ncbi:uncharacterized protein LOC103317389 [Nasonia vitripennis]|uniref:Single domain-containing protein n=1 Tax=Nasonia vitripennis TaxID=7425 RepID=A0A7M7IV91_NASVI|nr:uncharacterized protein LOC103317389 [Nasonia vitripennis]XP_016842352.1 uncharacterized protein LOC103317389 [Nasonia vitripennis]
MKTIFICCFVIMAVTAFGQTQAAPDQAKREKRYLAIERCPENSPSEECITYAEEKSKGIKLCHTFEMRINRIYWQGCGTVFCGENTKLVKKDLSMPFPDCCEYCLIIDDNKEAYASGTF